MGWGRKGCSDGTVIPESQDNHLNDTTKKVTCGQQRLLESEKREVISDSEGRKWLSGGRGWDGGQGSTLFLKWSMTVTTYWARAQFFMLHTHLFQWGKYSHSSFPTRFREVKELAQETGWAKILRFLKVYTFPTRLCCFTKMVQSTKSKCRLVHFPLKQPICHQYNFNLPTRLYNEFSSWAAQTYNAPITPQITLHRTRKKSCTERPRKSQFQTPQVPKCIALKCVQLDSIWQINYWFKS